MSSAAELIRKLGIKARDLVVVVKASPGTLAEIAEALPPGATLVSQPSRDARPNVVLLWLAEGDDFYEVFQFWRRAVHPAGAIWVVISRKQAMGKKAGGVTFGQVQAAALNTDLVDNKVASFPGEEYGVRFVVRKERRGE